MTDRTPTYPGRVKLEPVSGQTNIYDMTMSDEPIKVGTPLNKATFLDDSTVNDFGLTQADPTVNDAFSWISKFNLHWWSRNALQRTIINTDSPEAVIYGGQASTFTLHYGTSVHVDSNGNIVFDNEQTTSVARSSAGATTIAGLAPCYILVDGVFYYVPTGATGGTQTYHTICYTQMKLIFGRTGNPMGQSLSVLQSYGDAELLYSSNRNAHPDSGVDGGYAWNYRGKPFAQFPILSKADRSFYVGTGAFGSGNENSIEFDFKPALVLIVAEGENDYTAYMDTPYIWGKPLFTTKAHDGTVYQQNVTISGNTMSWATAGGNANYQLNTSGKLYSVIAFG